VNLGIVIKVLGKLLILEALLMIPSLLIALYLGEPVIIPFAASIALTFTTGYALSRFKSQSNRLKAKEGLSIVATGWLLASVFGSLPFIFSGLVPSVVDAFFETVSGLTTTGATIVTDIEILPKALLFWRSFTHWIGGMGILVFTIALLPTLGVGGFQIFRAESPGPVTDKIVPRIKDTAKILYVTYIALTLLEIFLLKLGGMSWYESALHTFGTVGTGGFSSRNGSIGAFDSTYIHLVISVFMVLSGTNFALHYALIKGKWRDVVKNPELKLYLGIILSATALIGFNLILASQVEVGLAFRDAFFQVSSIITTTGYSTVDFDQWSTFAKAILFVLMFIGGSSGSTGGGIKNIRILVLVKLVKREVTRIFHPRAVIPIKIGDKAAPREMVSGITSFFVLYILIFVIGTLVISLENISLESAASAVAVTLGNVGPGFGSIGPTETFAGFSNFSKLFLSLLMLLGRLELFTIIALIAPKAWRNEV